MNTFNPATVAQNRAAEPRSSTWVSANAGSGKTTVLTNRVARLLLQGTEPQKILCLTYTKAAAAEMQNRLFERLGSWAMMQDDQLRDELVKLGENNTDLKSAKLRDARTLFANALETPGGLKIQTIHSFCDKLLRQFPLEAAVSPQFQVLEDRQAKAMRAEILEQISDGPSFAKVDGLAEYLSDYNLDAFLYEVAGKRAQVEKPISLADFGLTAGDNSDNLVAQILTADARDFLRNAAALMQDGKATDIKNAKLISVALNGPQDESVLPILESVFLFGKTAKSGPYSAKIDAVPTKTLRDDNPVIAEALNDLMQLIEETRRTRLALAAFKKTQALSNFAQEFVTRYQTRKALTGHLDYDDLIAKSNALLADSSAAQWVLFKLDGGIEHILVDEAQDTSPEQWKIVSQLATEITTSADPLRTLFVVGDEKQSIYSFQGADPSEFGKMRSDFAARMFEHDGRLEEQDLLYSFRSADPILRLVDAVFDGPAGMGLARHTKHIPFKSDLPGRVDLWPFLEKEDSDTDAPWFEPVDMPSPNDPRAVLAKQIAQWAKTLLDSRTVLPDSKPARAIHAGDILVLVQRRGPLFRNILKELKILDLPVAGADRLNVGDELAVRDILSLLKFADLPEDDLSLAEALRSPILGFSEAELFTLAYGRKGFLWEVLRDQKASFPDQLDLLWEVLTKADFLRPFELIDLILTKHKGRSNLLARLGEEAEDGIDELLAQALRYEQVETPTLSGFLNWFESGAVEIKREMDSGAGQIRVMTVHGAKGLEAPIVVLPDTAKTKQNDSNQIVTLPDGGYVWKSSTEEASDVQVQAQAGRKAFLEQERMRLLYVAMTRAEQWLVIAGAGDPGKEGESWYDLVRSGLNNCAVQDSEIPGIGAARSLIYNWKNETAVSTQATDLKVFSAPSWLDIPAPVLPRPEQMIAPSKLPGAKIVEEAGGVSVSEQDALRKGRQVHVLLEHMVTDLADAERLLVGENLPENPAELARVFNESQAVLSSDSLKYLFDSNSMAEVGITATIDDLGGRIEGYIDRLVVDKNRVLAVDFKTNAVVPDSGAQVPLGVLRQLGCYLVGLKQIYPNHQVEVAVLWTANAELMVVDHNIVMEALQSTPTS